MTSCLICGHAKIMHGRTSPIDLSEKCRVEKCDCRCFVGDD